MIGPLEIVIILVILLVAFGGYKKLPQLGRSAGRNARIGGEKAKELADTVGGKVGDRFDPAGMGRSAGKGVREARDLRDSFKGTLDPPKPTEAETAPAAATPVAKPAPTPAAEVPPEPAVQAAAEPEAEAPAEPASEVAPEAKPQPHAEDTEDEVPPPGAERRD